MEIRNNDGVSQSDIFRHDDNLQNRAPRDAEVLNRNHDGDHISNTFIRILPSEEIKSEDKDDENCEYNSDLDEGEKKLSIPTSPSKKFNPDKDIVKRRWMIFNYLMNYCDFSDEYLTVFVNMKSHLDLCEKTTYWNAKINAKVDSQKIVKYFEKFKNSFMVENAEDGKSLFSISSLGCESQENEEEVKDSKSAEEMSFKQILKMRNNVMTEFKDFYHRMNFALIYDFINQYHVSDQENLSFKVKNIGKPIYTKENIDWFVTHNIEFSRCLNDIAVSSTIQYPEVHYFAKFNWELAHDIQTGDTLQLLGFNYFQNKNHFDKEKIEEIKGSDCGVIELKFNSDKCFDAHEIMNDCDCEDDCYTIITLPYVLMSVEQIITKSKTIVLIIAEDNKSEYRNFINRNGIRRVIENFDFIKDSEEYFLSYANIDDVESN